MKSTTLTAVALTLLMLLLVLLAAFVFLFQGQLALRDSLGEAEATIQSQEAEQARLRIEAAAAAATLTAVESLHATAAADSALLESDLAASAQQAALLESRLAETVSELETAQATREAYEQPGPIVTLLEPAPETRVLPGDSVPLLIVASDPIGVRTVSVSIGQDLLDTPVTPGTTIVLEETWVPEASGTAIISVSAANMNGVTSKSSIVSVIVEVPPPTPTTSPTPPAN